MSVSLTTTQANCFNFVKAYIGATGVGPSYQEIADHLHLRSRGTVNRILNALVERGAIERLPYKARALSIPEELGTAFRVDPHPEIRQEMLKYALKHRISLKAAAEEALRAYFVEAQ